MPDEPAAVDSVLLITSDQQRADSLGILGQPLPTTPRLDALAAEGVTFGDARCQHPYCQPSRWTILTGLHPRGHGVWTNGVDPSDAAIAAALSTRATAAGVRTGLVGKAHLASNGPWRSAHAEAFGNAWSIPADWTGPYLGFSRVELVQLGHFPFGFGPAPFGLHYGRFLAEGGHLAGLRNFYRASPLGRRAGSPRGPQTWESGLPEALHPTTWVADRTIAALERWRDDRFLLWASFPDPHHPFDPPAPWSTRFDPRDVTLPRRDAAELDHKPPMQKRFANGFGGWVNAVNVGGSRITDAELATMIAAYLGMVAQIDHAVARILAAVDALGLGGRTAVVYTSDHGELLGDHGLIFKGPFHYRSLLRVPLIARAADLPAGKRHDGPVGLHDLAPTIARWLGLPAAPSDGIDLADLVSGRASRDAVLTENDNHLAFHEHVQTVSTAGAVLSRHVGRPYGELYLRGEDPDERVNRWDDLPGVRRELEARLDHGLPPWRVPQAPPVTWFPG